VLSSLRGPDGGPALHTRLIAIAVVVGLLALASPVVVGILDWVFSSVV
jgi:hypothetical protein